MTDATLQAFRDLADAMRGMTDRPALELPAYRKWLATKAVKFHSRPRQTVVIRPMSAAAYAAAVASLTLSRSR